MLQATTSGKWGMSELDREWDEAQQRAFHDPATVQKTLSCTVACSRLASEAGIHGSTGEQAGNYSSPSGQRVSLRPAGR